MKHMLSLENCQKLFDYCSEGVVIFNDAREVIFKNRSFSTFPLSIQQQLLNQEVIPGYTCRWQPLDQGMALLVSFHKTELPTANDAILSNLLRTINSADNVYEGTVEAIFQALGWRWVSVTRLHDGCAEVLAHWDTNRIAENFSFELAGAPCEVMVRNKHYTLFTDVAAAFPNNEAMQAIQAKTYAGLLYRDSEQKAVGHIMAIHDQADVNYMHAENVLHLASLALSSKLQLEQARDDLQSAVAENRIDHLTGLANRRDFDQAFDSMLTRYRQHQEDGCIAVIDINNFKPFNDNFGHLEGDRLLKLLASELSGIGREHDSAYRIGGDEFALLFPTAYPSLVPRIQNQLNEATKRLSMVCEKFVSLSSGFAFLSEVDGDRQKAYQLADQRMYEHKAHSKAG